MLTKKITPIALVLLFVISLIINPLLTSVTDAQTQITRDEVEQRALKMTNLVWTYSKSKNSNIASMYSGKVTLPKQFNNITSATMTGIPYNWGGMDGIDSSSYNTPWNSFSQAVSQGAYTGNVNSKGGIGYVPGTAGLDCSGFIQSAFNINDYKISTSTIFNKHFTKININDIKRMDILNKPGHHAVIFDRWGYNNGIYGAFTYESTVDQLYGGIQGAKKYFRSINEINNGYIAGRYIRIVEPKISQVILPTIKPEIFAQVNNVNEFANFRSLPSTTATIIGTIPKSSIIYLNDYSDGWYKISYNGTSGWLWGNTVGLLPSGKFVTIKDAYMLNVRKDPSSTSSIVGVMTNGNYAEVLEISSDNVWYKVNLNGKIGWATGRYLSYIY